MMNHKRNKTIRKPSEAFQFCPACKSKELIRLDVDVLCGDCDWMSCEEFVESGGMDNIFAAFREHFAVGPEDELIELVAPTDASPEMVHEILSAEPLDTDELFETEVGA